MDTLERVPGAAEYPLSVLVGSTKEGVNWTSDGRFLYAVWGSEKDSMLYLRTLDPLAGMKAVKTTPLSIVCKSMHLSSFSVSAGGRGLHELRGCVFTLVNRIDFKFPVWLIVHQAFLRSFLMMVRITQMVVMRMRGKALLV
jgi:hypothetical protein